MQFWLIIFLFANIYGNGIPQSELKNVQVLPFTSKSEIQSFMKKTVASELGVKCNFCHNITDYSSDEKENKIVAREMMKMVKYINSNTLKPLKLHEISCWNCHRGKAELEHREK